LLQGIPTAIHMSHNNTYSYFFRYLILFLY
jgi:hypothetical protein